MGRRTELSRSEKRRINESVESYMRRRHGSEHHRRSTPTSNMGELQHDSQGFFVRTDKGDRVNLTNAEEAGYKAPPKEGLTGQVHSQDDVIWRRDGRIWVMDGQVGYDTAGVGMRGGSLQFDGTIKPQYFKAIVDEKKKQARFAKEQSQPRFSTALDWIQEYAEQYKSQIDKLVSGLSLGVEIGTIRERGYRLEGRLPLIEYHLKDRSDGRELSESNRITLANLRKLSAEYKAILDLEERVNSDPALKSGVSARVEIMCQTYYQIKRGEHYHTFLAALAENNGKGKTLTEEKITQTISLIPQINAALEQVSPREVSVCGGYLTVPAYENLKEMQQTLATNPSILERREANGEINLLQMPPDIRIAENFIRRYSQYFERVRLSRTAREFYTHFIGVSDRTMMGDYGKLDKALKVIEHHGGKNTKDRELGSCLTDLCTLLDQYSRAIQVRFT